jgi:hypothetical protein
MLSQVRFEQLAKLAIRNVQSTWEDENKVQAKWHVEPPYRLSQQSEFHVPHRVVGKMNANHISTTARP